LIDAKMEKRSKKTGRCSRTEEEEEAGEVCCRLASDENMIWSKENALMTKKGEAERGKSSANADPASSGGEGKRLETGRN